MATNQPDPQQKIVETPGVEEPKIIDPKKDEAPKTEGEATGDASQTGEKKEVSGAEKGPSEPPLPTQKVIDSVKGAEEPKIIDPKKDEAPKTEAKNGDALQTGKKKEVSEVEKAPSEPPLPPEPFDPYVQKVIDSVTDKIKAKTGIDRDKFEGISFCQYVSEEMAYYVKFHQVDDMFMHVKIAKPFIPMLQETWEVPFEVEEVRMNQKDEEKVRVWDKTGTTLDRDRKEEFYSEKWIEEDKKLGVNKPRINYHNYELEAALKPD